MVKTKIIYHSKIRKSTNYKTKVHIAIKYLNFMNFSKFPIGVETALDKIHFIK